jgi:glutathione S-transferase
MSASNPTHPDEPLVLASHALCPYVQRAAIVLDEKGVAFRAATSTWPPSRTGSFAVSPLGKTPVLLVHGAPIFESAVICEYLDECLVPRLHPTDALARARHRSWIEFGSQLLNGIGASIPLRTQPGSRPSGRRWRRASPSSRRFSAPGRSLRERRSRSSTPPSRRVPLL